MPASPAATSSPGDATLRPSGGRLAVLGAALVWSTGGAAVKASGLDAASIAGGRAAFALIALVVLFGARGRPHAGIALPGAAYAATCVLFVAANTLTTAGAAIFLQNTAPFWVLLLAPLLLGERASRAQLWSLPFGLLGSLLFALEDRALGRGLGTVVALASSVTYALSILAYRARSDRDGRLATVYGNLAIVLATLPWWIDARPSATDLAVLAYLGVVQQAVGSALFIRGIQRVSALEASLLLLIEPVLSPVWAYAIHGETLGPLSLAGAAVLVFATVGRTALPWWRARATPAG